MLWIAYTADDDVLKEPNCRLWIALKNYATCKIISSHSCMRAIQITLQVMMMTVKKYENEVF